MSNLLWTAAGFLGAVFLFVLKLLVPLLQKDLEEGVPWLAAWLTRRAARKLPAEHQQRFEEEWLAELTAVPGVMVFKLRFALGVSLRARSTSRAMRTLPRWWEEMLRRLADAMARTWRSYADRGEWAPRELLRRLAAAARFAVQIGDLDRIHRASNMETRYLRPRRSSKVPIRGVPVDSRVVVSAGQGSDVVWKKSARGDRGDQPADR